jgi:hypothetical protein
MPEPSTTPQKYENAPVCSLYLQKRRNMITAISSFDKPAPYILGVEQRGGVAK